MLLNIFYKTNLFSSITYEDMPFIACPNIWKLISSSSKKQIEASERLHSDGVVFDNTSPEAFEEAYWINFDGHPKQIDLFKKFRRRVLAREVDVVKEALQLYLKGSLKFRTLSKGLNVPSDWFCKDDDSTYLDWILLQSIARYGLNTRAFDIVRGVYKKDTSKNSDRAEDAEMEDFEDEPMFLVPDLRDEEEGRWDFRAQGPFAGVGIAVDLRGVNQTWEGPKPMFADKLLKIHFALDSFDVYKIDTLLHRSKLKKEQLFVV